MRVKLGILSLSIGAAAACAPASSPTGGFTGDATASTATSAGDASATGTTDASTTSEPSDTTAITEATSSATDAAEDVSSVTGACTNEDDFAVIDSNPGAVAATTQQCALQCLSAGDSEEIRACAIDCMLEGSDQTEPVGLSEDCAGCYADMVICVVDDCANVCVPAPDSSECIECRETNCNPQFYTCSGLPDD